MRTVLEQLLDQRQPVVVVDDDSGVVEQMGERGVTAIRGDGADAGVLRAARANEARLIVSTMRRRHDNERLLRLVHGQTVLVRVCTPEEGAHIKSLGGTPIVESESAADDFLQRLDEADISDDLTISPNS